MPDAPTSATISPGRTTRLAPRSTRTTSGPERYSFSSSSAIRSGSVIGAASARPPHSPTAFASFVAQDVHGLERARAPRRDDRRDKREEERRSDHHEPV